MPTHPHPISRPWTDARSHPSYDRARGLTPLISGGRKRQIAPVC